MIAEGPPAYDEPTSLSRPHAKVLPKMMLNSAAQLVSLAAEEGGHHDSLSPAVTGGSALVILLLLLWITTRFNRDR
ncbi:hypothetical protein [Streptomyces misionensis]|uniref:hypothetical protein n=2 Tax=Streptomyces misionensis TaxID=67331 RepID=UPI0011B5AED8|nr:hypothetical protein [Streptomyces misionensis]